MCATIPKPPAQRREKKAPGAPTGGSFGDRVRMMGPSASILTSPTGIGTPAATTGLKYLTGV